MGAFESVSPMLPDPQGGRQSSRGRRGEPGFGDRAHREGTVIPQPEGGREEGTENWQSAQASFLLPAATCQFLAPYLYPATPQGRGPHPIPTACRAGVTLGLCFSSFCCCQAQRELGGLRAVWKQDGWVCPREPRAAWGKVCV